MISGAHMIVYSANAAADRAFFRDVLGFPSVDAAIRTLKKHKVKCDPVADRGWGLLTHLSLPGGGKLGLYQPKHPVAARRDEIKPLL